MTTVYYSQVYLIIFSLVEHLMLPLICCRMIEIGQKSFPQIFRQEGLAQKVLILHMLILGNLIKKQ
jgi:hypothetical protein